MSAVEELTTSRIISTLAIKEGAPSIEVSQLDRVNVVGDVGFLTKIVDGYSLDSDSGVFSDMVDMARERYLIYGDVDLRDKYDRKSIVGWTYALDISEPANESFDIVTLRFVPLRDGEGVGFGSEDVDMFIGRYKGDDSRLFGLTQYLEEKGIDPDKVCSMSRLARVGAGGSDLLPVAFSELQIELCKRARDMGITHLISQQSPYLPRMLSFENKLYPFCMTGDFFKDGSLFQLNRWNKGVLDKMNRYPGYFYSIKDIQRLVREYYPQSPKWTLDSARELWSQYVDGNSQLQESVRKTVPDGSFFSIATLDDWQESALAIINQYANK